jgi:hypothetical protein
VFAHHTPVAIHTTLLVQEKVLEGDLLALHALDFGNVGNLATAVPQTRLMNNEVKGRGYLLTNGS